MGTPPAGIVIFVSLLGVGCCMQSFERQPQYTEVNPAQTALLDCRVQNKAGRCSWQKDGFPIGAERSKYEWFGSPEQGDCSLRVLGADLKYDDGVWSCQVTASSFQTQDALKSSPARLVVRVKPRPPEIGSDTERVAPDQTLTVRAAQQAEVLCRARHGNPPAALRWLLGEEDLTHLSTQRNETDPENGKTFSAVSILGYKFVREMAGRHLRCVAVHRAYDTNSSETAVQLNVHYRPTVKILGAPQQDVECGEDDVVLRCAADANPEATVTWHFRSKETALSKTFQTDTLELRPASKESSGTYFCEAENVVGRSERVAISLDVKYAPSKVEVGPHRRLSLPLHNTTELSCRAAAYPTPVYQWLQRSTRDDSTVRVGTGPQLRLENVTYHSQGQYVCVASNVIKGQERRIQSDVINVRITGGPQVDRQGTRRRLLAELGSSARLEAVFCASPPARLVTWHWVGGQPLQAGQSRGRFTADDVKEEDTEDCYRARLHVNDMKAEDEKAYTLQVQNDLGRDQHTVSLMIKGARLLAEPATMATVISLVCGCLLLLVLVVALVLHAARRRKCCFSEKNSFKSSDLESKGSEQGSREAAARHGLGAIPPDALYAASKRHRHVDDYYGPQQQEPGISSGGCDISPHLFLNSGLSGGAGRAGGGIIYADLQLPKASNNGSMRRHRQRELPQPQQAAAHNLSRTEYAQIKFVPKLLDQHGENI